MLGHIVGGNFTHVEIETDERLGAPAQFFKLQFLEIATIEKSAVERTSPLSHKSDKLVLVEGFPGTLNHFFPKFAILLEGSRFGSARVAEVAEDFVHEVTIARFGSRVKGVNRLPGYG